MNLALLMTINAVVAAVFGIAFVIAPGQAVSLYGVSADAPLRYIAQLFGAALLGFAVLTWMARKEVTLAVAARNSRRPVLPAGARPIPSRSVPRRLGSSRLHELEVAEPERKKKVDHDGRPAHAVHNPAELADERQDESQAVRDEEG